MSRRIIPWPHLSLLYSQYCLFPGCLFSLYGNLSFSIVFLSLFRILSLVITQLKESITRVRSVAHPFASTTEHNDLCLARHMNTSIFASLFTFCLEKKFRVLYLKKKTIISWYLIDSLKLIFTSLVVFNMISIRDLLNIVCLIKS